MLEGQPEDVRSFLLDTSVLDDLSGPLCDAVTGRTDGQQQLEALERANLFVVALDEQRQWWRYHHLFAEALRARLMAQDPERVARGCVAPRRSGTPSTAVWRTPCPTPWPATTSSRRPSWWSWR